MKRIALLSIAVCVLCVSMNCYALPKYEAEPESPIGYNISEMQTTDIFGNEVSGDIFKKYELTFVLLWAVWSSASLYSMDTVQKFADYYKELNVNVMGIYLEDEAHPLSYAIKQYTENEYTYVTLRYVHSEHLYEMLDRTYGTMPIMYIIDNEGEVVDSASCSYMSEYGMKRYIDMHREAVNTVEFIDSVDNSLIFRTYIPDGENAIYPNIPKHDDWIFERWDKSVVNITEDMVITAVFYSRGDANCNQLVNSGDAVTILQFVVGNRHFSELEMQIADVNSDGKVDTADVVCLLERIASE